MFAETVTTAGGLSLSLAQLLELLTRDRPVPIVPVCIEQVGGLSIAVAKIGHDGIGHSRSPIGWSVLLRCRVSEGQGEFGEVYRALQRLSAGQPLRGTNPGRWSIGSSFAWRLATPSGAA